MSLALEQTRWRSPPPRYDTHSTSSSSLKPYLELPHLLSLTWLAYPILSLLFVIFRLQLSLSSSQDALASAKGDIVASCQAAEKAATAAASMPRYMAAATNRQFADAVNDTMNGARAALVLSLTVMESIINFIVDIYRSTFLCFVELVIHGGLAILIGAVQELNLFVQNTAASIRTSIQNDITTANSAIQGAVSAFNKINPFGNVNIPQFDIPSLSALQNITLPTDFENALVSLNSSLPTFSELKDKVNALIDTPFELLKADINDTFANLTFDSSVLPVPQENTLTFCDQLDTSVVDDLARDLLKAAEIGTVILIIVALLLVAGNCALEWYKWRCLKRHLERTRQAWMADPTLHHTGSDDSPQVTLNDHNLLVLRGISAHPLLTRIAYSLESLLRLSPSQHTRLQWFFHYIFHPPALACFLIGFFGLLSVQIQLAAVGPLEAKFNARAASSATDLSNLIVTSVNSSMFNQSSLYANDINSRVDNVQTTINSGLFGWVNGTTTSLNDTLNEFYNDVQNVVSVLFNGTVLEAPAQDFVHCLIGSKVDALEKALTFLNQNLQVNIPRVNESVLILSPGEVNEATQPIADAAIGGGQGNSQGFVSRLINTYVNSLKKERVMFGVFMILWILVVLMGIAIVLWHSFGKPWTEAYRRRKWQRERQSGINDFVSARKEIPTRDEKEGRVLDIKLPSFTPLPSPTRAFPLNDSKWNARQTLRSPEPKFGKSWDSFFSNEGAGKEKKVSVRDKLMAIGRKVMGREKFVPDEGSVEERSARHDEASSNRPPATVSWLSTITPMARWRNESSGGTKLDGTRPDLRISVDCASEVDQECDIDHEPNMPSRSAIDSWSASTLAPPATPWMNRVSPTEKQTTASHQVSPFNVSSNVNSVYEDAALLYPPITPIVMPLPVQSRARQPRIRPSSPSPQLSPRFSTQYAAFDKFEPSPSGRDQSEVTTPLTKFLTTTHARKSSCVNPFATPFDDEHRAPISLMPTNPFTTVAL